MPSSVSLSDPTYLGSGSSVLAVMRDGGALGGEPLGDGLAEPTAAARDERDLPCTSTRHELRYYADAGTAARPRPPASIGSRRSVPTTSRRSPVARRASPTPPASTDRRVVVKVAPPGLPPVLNRDVLRQARLIRALHDTAVPVPDVLWEDAGDPPDEPPLFVMSFVEGASLEPLFDRHGDDPEAVVAERMRDAARTLAALHALDPAVPRSRRRAGGRPAERRSTVGAGCSRPSTRCSRRAGEAWPSLLRRHRNRRRCPPRSCTATSASATSWRSAPTVTAVIDWEIWTVGDPRIDLGWFLANADPATYRARDAVRGCVAVTGRVARGLRRGPRSRRRRRRRGSRRWRASSRRRRGR